MKPIFESAMHTTDHLKDAASRTRANFLELGVQTMKLVNTVRAEEARTFTKALGRLGLQRRENPLRPFAIFVAGAAIVGGAALLFAPTSGRKTRKKIIRLFGRRANEQTSRSVIEVPTALDPKADGIHVSNASGASAGSDHSSGH